MYYVFQFLVWTGGQADETAAHLENRGAPTIWLKTGPKRAKTKPFLVFLVGAPRVLE